MGKKRKIPRKYFAGLGKQKRAQMRYEIERFRDKPDDYRRAYKPWTADKGVKPKKKSKATKAYHRMFGKKHESTGGSSLFERVFLEEQEKRFSLKPLPYTYSALAPTISEAALREHHRKHHGGYVRTLNELLDSRHRNYRGWSLEKIIRGVPDGRLRNNACQTWNHEFLWQSMKPNGGGTPKGDLANCVKRCFGGYARFKEEFVKRGLMQFGSGWLWLVKDGDGNLEIVTTANEETPFAEGAKCLLVADLWEHAYYLDFKSNRKAYLRAFLAKLVNWDFAAQNYGKLTK